MEEPTGKERSARPPGATMTLEEALDAALASYPAAALPPGFVARTMARLEPARPAPAPAGLRLSFLDLALPAFVAALSLVALSLLAGALHLDPLLTARLALWWEVTGGALLPGLPLSGGMALTSLAALTGGLALAVTVALDRARRGPSAARY